MVDKYKYNPAGVSETSAKIKKLVNEYNDKIVQLASLNKEISSSPAWYDLDIKGDYMQTCEAYSNIYKKLIVAMDDHIKYLDGKSGVTDQLDTAYTR